MLTRQNLNTITEGMEVYDRDGTRIGTVKAFRLGEGTIKTSETDIVTMANAVSECLSGKQNLPTILYSRLYDEGFICVKRGFLRSDVIVFPNQIDDISSDAIYLYAEQSELLKI